jgi:hypothetical protein
MAAFLSWRSILSVAAVGLASVAAAVTPASTQAGGFLDQVRSRFATWDADHDGTLSEQEIERALDDPANAGPAGAAIATIRRTFYASKFRPITLAHLTAAVNHDAAGLAGDDGKPPAYEAMYEADLAKIEKTNRDLFATGTPKVETLGQGRLGDCFLLAPVGTVAACQPDRMRQMVTTRPDGQVAVHFGDGQTVTLPPPTDGEIAIGANAYNRFNDGVWANVFEKAIGHILLERQRTAGKFVTPYQIIGVGGSPATPMSILTGHKLKRVGCEDFQKPGKLVGAAREARLNEMRDELEAAFKSGKLVVGGTADIHAGETVVRGLYYDHSYGVLGYDRKADVVHFWNPMGNGFKPKGEPGLANGYPTSHGRFDCPLTEAVMWFGSFSIETDEPAGNPTKM